MDSLKRIVTNAPQLFGMKEKRLDHRSLSQESIIDTHYNANNAIKLHPLAFNNTNGITNNGEDGGIDVDGLAQEMDERFRQVAMGALITWFSMVTLSYGLCHRSGHLERLTGVERAAPLLAATLMGVSCMSKLIPFIFRQGGVADRNTKSPVKTKVSGVIAGAVVVQLIALMTSLMLGLLMVPVMVNPVTGSRIFLLRWCEWTPLAFVMTFLTEGAEVSIPTIDRNITSVSSSNYPPRTVDSINSDAHENCSGSLDIDPLLPPSLVDEHHSNTSTYDTIGQEKAHAPDGILGKAQMILAKNNKLRSAYFNAWCQGLSTLAGWLFAFTESVTTWAILFTISTVLFAAIFVRVHDRRKAFQKMTFGTSAEDREIYNWTRLSLKLLITCAVMWSLLVATYCVYTILPAFAPEDSFLHRKELTMVCECTLDVTLKVLYLVVILDVYHAVFDQGARSERRLDELRKMMSVVWNNSSDVIGISVRSPSGTVTTMLSPTYVKVHSSDDNSNIVEDDSRALTFELDPIEFQVESKRKVNPKMVYDVEFIDMSSIGKDPKASSPDADNDASSGAKEYDFSGVSREEICSVADLVVRAWNINDIERNETLLMHDLIRKKESSLHPIRCEAKINRLEKNALVIVVRDISERFRRFEAEKKVISETTAREKDAEANRFTRHEVKNGLLAAIGLCDSLRESLPQGMDGSENTSKPEYDVDSDDYKIANSNCISNLDPSSANLCIVELDKTLHEVLDTILAEAMARDVIHECYEPKLERVDIYPILCNDIGGKATTSKLKRFPLITKPSPLPHFAMDPQLLKYIHRNAVSNACKYGKKGGVVVTEVEWDEGAGMLKMDVINLPGEYHKDILKMGDLASQIVFSPRQRLEIPANTESTNHTWESLSSGDGAWIMHKCAKTLGGNCDIKFEESRTVFAFQCPVVPYEVTELALSINYKNFKLPDNIYGIAIDDSKIQRKLLKRFLLYTGISEDRIHVFGSDASEVKGFDNWVCNFIQDHPTDYFLLLVDENLDIFEEQSVTKHVTISGSLSVSNIRQRLLPNEERRMLALIRSANDSAHDVAIYNSRAHGYLPKSPIKKDNALEALAPIFVKRFPESVAMMRMSEYERKKSCQDFGLLDNDAPILKVSDLYSTIEEIDKLVSSDSTDLPKDWPVIWEKMHSLKGDLLILPSQEEVSTAVGMITALRGSVLPTKFVEKWNTIRTLIVPTK